MGKIRNEVFKRLDEEKIEPEEAFFRTYDLLMSEYGWVSPEEYLKLPQQTVNELAHQIKRRKEEENKIAKGGKGKKSLKEFIRSRN